MSKKILIQIKVLVLREEEGYSAIIESLPGCITQGNTEEELRKMLQDVVNMWFDINREYDFILEFTDDIDRFVGNDKNETKKSNS